MSKSFYVSRLSGHFMILTESEDRSITITKKRRNTPFLTGEIDFIFLLTHICTKYTQKHTVRTMTTAFFLLKYLFLSFLFHLPTTYSTTISLYLVSPHYQGNTECVCLCTCVFHQNELISCDRSQGESQTTAVNTDLSIAFSFHLIQNYTTWLSSSLSLPLPLACAMSTSLLSLLILLHPFQS